MGITIKEQGISMEDPNGTYYTTKDGDVVSVDYDKTITVGNDYYITQVELDERGVVISYTVLRDGAVLLDLDADEYKKFNNNDLFISGERLRLTMKKIRKAKACECLCSTCTTDDNEWNCCE